MVNDNTGREGINMKLFVLKWVAMNRLAGLHVLVFLCLIQYFIVYEMCRFRETRMFMGICNFDIL